MATSTPTRTELLDLYRHIDDQVATVYLPSPSAREDAEQLLAIRRKNVISALDDAGADDQLIELAASTLDDLDHEGGPAHLIVLSPNRVLASVALKRPVTRSTVLLGPVPALLPVLAATQTDVEHLAVLLDRTGADVMPRSGVADPVDSIEVEGPDVRVHRSHPGGWSQKRFQQTAENAWENNAAEVVDQIRADYPDADVIICGGDERATGFFVDHLPEHIEVHRVEGSRHADPDAFLDAADVALRTRAASEIVELLDRWRTQRAADLGTTGLEVLDLLTQGRVDHLLVVDDTEASERYESTFDFDRPAHMPEASDATLCPASDAAVALAIATGANVTVVPDHPDLTTGLAAILRF